MEDVIERKPWDQMEGEPNEAYARFLVYRNLGPLRSLAKANANRRSKGTPRKVPKGTKKPQAPGSWKVDSLTYHWHERATAWDVAMLSDSGSRVVVMWVESLAGLSEIALEAIRSGRRKPKNLADVLSIINVLGNFVTPETVEAARQFTRGDLGQNRSDNSNPQHTE